VFQPCRCSCLSIVALLGTQGTVPVIRLGRQIGSVPSAKLAHLRCPRMLGVAVLHVYEITVFKERTK